jgi:hypothetical protein
MSLVVKMQWVIVPAYDLTVETVNKFLSELFPFQIYRIKNFYTEVFQSLKVSMLETHTNAQRRSGTRIRSNFGHRGI